MAKHDTDPVLQQLVRSVNESGQAAVPVTVSAHGTIVTGMLIAQARYFSELVERNPMMGALEPASGLLGKDYVKDVDSDADYHLHVRGSRISGDGAEAEGLWRISLPAVDAWILRAGADTGAGHEAGPFARLLGNG
ncbi:MAG: hypothetical protein JOY82_00560 [Streptosporangiaceae bacterium]|nr:hypothetical protein [Streptosporangiaceae bacterium]MBV9853004.1 hypothetical protein [Streptosporangiaceae bacterium]